MTLLNENNEFDIPDFRGDHMKGKVVSVDYHRNGVGGAGFVTAAIKCQFNDEGDEQMFVTMSFFGYPSSRNTFIEQTGAVDASIAATGNVRFFENSWRGSDMFGEIVAEAFEKSRDYNPWED